MKRLITAICTVLACLPTLPSTRAEGDTDPRTALLNRVRETDIRNRAAFGNSPNHLVLPGLLADRSTQTVTFYAEATEVPVNDPVEFFLIGPQSGHDYEALAIAFVKPGDIRRGLEFLGMTPGEAVDFRALRFWPKGERVAAYCSWDAPDAETHRVRLETLVMDLRREAPLEPAGLVFIGSYLAPPPAADPGAEPELAADQFDPFSIASTYNEPASILDVPRRAVQGDVYRIHGVNPDLRPPADRLLTITMQPEFTNGHRRVIDVALEVSAAGETAVALDQAVFTIRREGAPTVSHIDLATTVQAFRKLVEDRHDPFVTFFPGNNVSLGTLHAIVRLLGELEGEHGIRMEAPPAGHLYYRAFDPPEAYRNRGERISQPWELHLSLEADRPAAELVYIREIWSDDSIQPRLEPESLPVTEPGRLGDVLASREKDIKVILVYAPPTMTYGQVMAYLRPVLDAYPIVHIFTE